MAFETPPHRERRLLIHQRHLVNGAVTGRAADALLHVNTVVEVDEVRKVVDAVPLKRLVVAKAGPHRLENGGAGPNLRVAVHARLGRRNVGERGLLDRGVAVTAVNPDAADVMRVAELDRLLD